jgi:hypothetical protein
MNLIKLRAKVLLVSEEQMEVEDKYDFGNIAKNKDWEWRNIAIPAGEIYRIIQFNETKSIVEMNSEEKILVAEAFDDLYKKWEESKSDAEAAATIIMEDGQEEDTREDEE